MHYSVKFPVRLKHPSSRSPVHKASSLPEVCMWGELFAERGMLTIWGAFTPQYFWYSGFFLLDHMPNSIKSLNWSALTRKHLLSFSHSICAEQKCTSLLQTSSNCQKSWWSTETQFKTFAYSFKPKLCFCFTGLLTNDAHKKWYKQQRKGCNGLSRLSAQTITCSFQNLHFSGSWEKSEEND